MRAALFALRLVLSLPLLALANGFDWLGHLVAGIGRTIYVEINCHPHLGYGVLSSDLTRFPRWHEDIHEAHTAAAFILNEAVEREAASRREGVPTE